MVLNPKIARIFAKINYNYSGVPAYLSEFFFVYTVYKLNI